MKLFCYIPFEFAIKRISNNKMEVETEIYLRSTSSLAQKIGQDIDAAREAYQDLWNTLSVKEQQQVLNEAIIDPAAVLKYSNTNEREHQELYESANGNQFSWFSTSQLNLFTDESLKWPKTPVKKPEVIATANNNPPQDLSIIENKAKENKLINKIKNKVTNFKIPSTSEEKQSLVETKPQSAVVKTMLSKPKTPPPPPPTKQRLSEKKALLSVDIDSDSDDIPKTGFDFLDNW